MALRWTAAAMNEAKNGFRRLKAYKQLPALRLALAAHYEKETNNRALVQTAQLHYLTEQCVLPSVTKGFLKFRDRFRSVSKRSV